MKQTPANRTLQHLPLAALLITAVVIFMGLTTLLSGQTDNVIIRAMKDELDRSMKSLKIENMEKPYYLEYSLWDYREFSIAGSFGSLTQSEEDHQRILKVGVRVGSYQLDNSGFIDQGSIYASILGLNESVVVEDDYNALRRYIWLATDKAYKDALEQLASKKAYIRNQVQTEQIPDFSKEESVQKIAAHRTLKVDLPKWEQLVKNLSVIFRQFPTLYESRVKMRISLLHKYFVNSEGSVFVQPQPLVFLVANASTQAADGMRLKHYIPFYSSSLERMPGEKKLASDIRSMAEELTALASAPVLEEYIGPVLFTGQAAAELFTQVLAPHLAGGRPPLSNMPQLSQMTASSKLAQRINRKVLPRNITIIDDPTRTDYNGTPLIGSYAVDDQGVISRPVKLVEKGILKTLLMSRRPSKKILHSNGHGRGSLMATPGTQMGNLLISTENGKTYQQLKQELIQMCKEQNIDFGLIVKTVDDPSLTGADEEELARYMSQGTQSESQLTPPVMLYRVDVKDGKEELVRGITISELTVSDLKYIAAVGNDSYILHRFVSPGGNLMGGIFMYYASKGQSSMGVPVSVVAPSILFDELEFKKSAGKRKKPPLMPRPFFDE
ncbi:MAG: metallopeptidase TldD-related protein [Candidatus Aminicenantes bacterium]|jgi:predicted Zn-dependent protease